MAVHVAYMVQVPVNRLGAVVDKSSASSKEMLNTSIEWRVLPDVLIPSSADYPTLSEFLTLEETAGFRVTVLSMSIIVTYDT